ncbi:membrane protein, partial [Streptomyces sp. NRRL F-6602]
MSTERSDQEQERPRRRSPMAVASVAAAVLIVGGGGAYLVTAAASGDAKDGGQPAGADAGDAPPPLELDGHTRGVAPGEPDPGGGVYQAKGKLPEGPGEAAVQRFEAPRETDVAKLAKALGVLGEPRTEGGSWLVGTAKDGQGPLLRVNKQAPGTWSYQGHTPPHGDD